MAEYRYKGTGPFDANDPYPPKKWVKIAACGTASGYFRHRTQGEPICEPCRLANAAASKERRKRKKPHE